MLLARPRRNRKSAAVRNLVEENILRAADLVMPFFVMEGENKKDEIKSLPGVFRLTLDHVLREAESLHRQGVPSIALFPVIDPQHKDEQGTAALHENGLIPRALQKIKQEIPSLCLITDIALDPFTSHGHDGVVDQRGYVKNDATVEILVKMANLLGAAGADLVAPSDMMDGRIGAIRKALEENNFSKTGIMAYSAKYASCFYGPFRDALDSAPGFGDKKTYQMNYANRTEAIKEALMDVKEGADIIMVKPALSYLDIIREVKNAVQVPVSAYNISGEYAMIKAAAKMGWIDENKAILETLTSMKRAGADLIATYFARDAVKLLQ